METAQHIKSFSASVPMALSNSVGFLLNEAAIVIREMDEAALSGLGINPRQLGILMTIAVEEPQSQQAIGAKHRIDRTTMVKLADGLEERGLIARKVHPHDRRSYNLSLTPQGEVVLEQALALVKETQDAFLGPLTQAEWEQLRQLLTRLLAHQGKLSEGETATLLTPHREP
jgi:DNA-binding MarR family transcriptional regulator